MFILKQDARSPLYVQLYEQFREHVLSGKLPAGTKLPSVRELADELAISRNTVETTYQELYAEGYIYAKPRSGYFVSATDHNAPPPDRASRTAAAQSQPPSPCVYDFHPARLDPASFPTALWRQYAAECLKEHAGRLTQYGHPFGEWPLRLAIQRYLEHARGVACNPEQVVICSGLQHSLDIVAQVLKDTQPQMAVENPGYPLPRSVFRNHSLNVTPIPVGSSGIDMEALERSGCDAVYVTPSHQFPLGHVLPIEHRLRLIDWAESGGNFIIEDDYDSELRYQGKPIPSLQGLSPQGNIIYSGTFSKILSPGLRISYMVLPEPLLRSFHRLFRNHLCPVSLLEQLTLAQFMGNGHFDKHIRRMRTVYKERHNALLAAVERHFGAGASVIGQGAGLHIVLQLSGNPPEEQELLAKAKDAGIRLFPFSETCFDSAPSPNTLLLGFGGMPSAEAEQGIALLAALCGQPSLRASARTTPR